MSSRLHSLAGSSTIVADTGEIGLIERFRPQDCTTNPSLLLKAARLDAYRPLVEEAVAWGRGRTATREGDIGAMADRLSVLFGRELTRLIPGMVSTEVDAALSFDTAATVAKAEQLLESYRELGVASDRILIKIAATWEGVRAAAQLQQRGINCNMTLIFSLAQAVASAEAGAFLISPFVGRITDWYRSRQDTDFPAESDPGVLSVREIYRYFKAHGYATVVMAASFRHCGQIEALAGCDRLTIAPSLLDELARESGTVPRALDPDTARQQPPEAIDVSEAAFRWLMNEDPMATEKLADGIRRFHVDSLGLRQYLATC